MCDLLTLDVLVFQWASPADKNRQRGLRSFIFDEAGNEAGVVIKERRRRWLAPLLDTRLSVYDDADTKVIEIIKRNWGWVRLPPTKIVDAAGQTAGSIVPKDFSRKRFILKRSSLEGTGRMEWQPSKDPDLAWIVVATDATGMETGRIVYPRNRPAAQRLRGDQTASPLGWRGRAQRFFPGSADSYSLTIAANCSQDLRLLMLGSAAGLNIVAFGKPTTDGG